jgi:hypothetical protein
MSNLAICQLVSLFGSAYLVRLSTTLECLPARYGVVGSLFGASAFGHEDVLIR